MSVSRTLRSRASIRGYTSREVPVAVVEAILDAARWSPSGGNLQPWKVIVVTGRARDEVCGLARRALKLNPGGEDGDFPVYPEHVGSPFRERRRRAALQRFAALGVDPDDKAALAAYAARNYDFWGAPVGLFFVIPRDFGHSQWAHLGMFIQSLALVAAELGLGTCVQEAWAKVRESLGGHFGLPRNEVITCGMALGYPDWSQAINTVRTARENVADFATFRGFEEQGRAA